MTAEDGNPATVMVHQQESSAQGGAPCGPSPNSPQSEESRPIALQACGLVLAWGDGEPVCEGIDLVVRQNDCVCIVGKSGTGKTTILHALAGLTTPREGNVLLHGDDVTGQAGSISYMLQKDLLLPNLTVIDNACLPLTLAGVAKREARAKARPLLERFGLANAADKWPDQLSGGMRQRAALLRTYLMGNDVIMLDEPFSALDAITRNDMRTWYREQAQQLGLSTLMITHDVDEACLLADCIFVLGRAADGQGVQAPARIIGEVHPNRSAADDPNAFSLTTEFLAAKTRVLELLG